MYEGVQLYDYLLVKKRNNIINVDSFNIEINSIR
jgi:hypothetical protein